MANGILIINKPADWTSMDVCAKLRGILKERKIGHGGTLDPMATGVLPVFVGSATRAVTFAENADKEYIAGLKLGVITDTQDTSGNVLEEHPVSVTQEDIKAILPQFTGEIQQVPPMYSAIKIKGQKLYELARKGIEVERKARTVTIFSLELLEQIEETTYLLRVHCSKGTYIRSLCHDIGQALGCGGTMSSLQRTMAAGFSLEDAVTLETVQEKGSTLLMPVDRFFQKYPSYILETEKQEKLCKNGNSLKLSGLSDGLYRVYDKEGNFLCLSRYEKEMLTSIKNFFGSDGL